MNSGNGASRHPRYRGSRRNPFDIKTSCEGPQRAGCAGLSGSGRFSWLATGVRRQAGHRGRPQAKVWVQTIESDKTGSENGG